jgi:hypothetical protein
VDTVVVGAIDIVWVNCDLQIGTLAAAAAAVDNKMATKMSPPPV